MKIRSKRDLLSSNYDFHICWRWWLSCPTINTFNRYENRDLDLEIKFWYDFHFFDQNRKIWIIPERLVHVWCHFTQKMNFSMPNTCFDNTSKLSFDGSCVRGFLLFTSLPLCDHIIWEIINGYYNTYLSYFLCFLSFLFFYLSIFVIVQITYSCSSSILKSVIVPQWRDNISIWSF